LALASLSLLCTLPTGCTAVVSDLEELETDADACDPRGTADLGTDLDLRFRGMVPHLNQDLFFAVTVGEERSIEAMMVIAGLDDPDLELTVPRFLPGSPSELAFWADSAPNGFDPINGDGDPIDHQWTRPVCPNGEMTFTHTTPFQDVQDAISTGAIFRFVIPEEIRRPALFDHLHMWVRAVKLADDDLSVEEQTRAYFRWAPTVSPGGNEPPPPPRSPPEAFEVGGNALGEPRGAIDTLSFYRIEFVIDVDATGDLSGGDYVCQYARRQAPDAMVWEFVPDLSLCDPPDGFDPEMYVPYPR
jgi:hypothetical protein